MKYIKFFKELNNKDVPLVGGKNASIGEMFQELVPVGIKVPNGFAITSEAYWYLLDSGGIRQKIQDLLEGVDVTEIDVLKTRSKKIRELIFGTPFPEDLRNEIFQAYKILSEEYGMKEADVAVRSSATAEDLPDASFAGQQDTYLSVKGQTELIHYIKSCLASLFTDRAVSYRASRGFDHFKVALSVGVQKMVRADKGSAGVMFSIDTETGFKDAVFITSSWGLGENVVGGMVNPDEFYVFKPTLKEGKRPIIKRQLGHKHQKMVYAPKGSDHPTKNIKTTQKEMKTFSITDADILTLARYAIKIEEHYTKEAGEYRPMDMEWSKDGESGEIFIVQARPETVQSQKNKKNSSQRLEKFSFTDKNAEREILLTGRAIGGKIGYGKVRIINDIEHMNTFKEGEILVTDNTDPDWEPVMKKASAVITNRGGRTCHAAIVAREIGVPAIVGAIGATDRLYTGMEVTVSCAEGEEGYIYAGIHPFEVEAIELDNLGKPKTKIYMNIGNPEKAFGFSQLPNDGVGLARMEHIILNQIKAHPLALLDLQNGKKDIKDRSEIEKLISGYESPKDFFIKKIAEGMGMISAAFYPKPVIVRTSDFKSNEYRGMIGGVSYEPLEENPMLGYRGASRYYSDLYRVAFEWECEALAMVREEMGLTNMKVMVPFLRTPEEGKKVLEIMRRNGLESGKNGLEIYVMCELPVNVILADDFLNMFDGFSIGSNDLTQLTLGVDRDGQLVSHIFDERNPAMLEMFKHAIQACKKHNKYCGICGQAPSDYPEIAEFLVKEGITSISLNPDSVVSTWTRIVALEKTLKQ
ncbi:pyruvate, water dikinase [Helicobacter fennelliae]|uniref:Phosphoenolpyruvate synthase n=1 Tax=Helicobacter fennelliae MRY12-0050 TaxID=1325130 RepID=T1CNR3_9HELI|nr:pyruvate, water dikinase [Helicobacter fennelliae]GAD18409.1 phosphoenolpyruvate synthase [Helicobacter fennelliae MRY12-0050]STP08207.1 phosphoenolpyruvate synthase [Helicobacter fennelliae]STQ83885.1 phosphoenolpyruvate synthase [Helicobacter fennelliae]